MKIYSGENAHYNYLCDRGISCSGTKRELDLEIRIWNFIAKIINRILGVKC
jgi:hypothetical protein